MTITGNNTHAPAPCPERRVRDYETSATMRAVGLTRRPRIGHVSDNLELLAVPTPRPSPGDVAIKVIASSLHIDEINAAQGTALGRFYAPKHMSPEHPHIMGSAVSGMVVGLGQSVDGFKLGDEVLVIPDKEPEADSWATYRCVDQQMVMHKPPSMSHQQSVATTMGACVAWGAVKMSGVGAGDHCVVVGASGSIGTMMMGYLKSLDCIVTAVGRGGQTEFMLRHGANNVVDYRTDNFADHAERTGRNVDAVFDCVGGRETESDGFRALGQRGVFVTVVGPMKYIGETKLSRLKTARVMGHVLRRIVTTRFRAKRYIFGEKPPRRVIDEALGRSIQHDIQMPITDVIPFDLDAIKGAVDAVLQHRSKGRIVIALE